VLLLLLGLMMLPLTPSNLPHNQLLLLLPLRLLLPSPLPRRVQQLLLLLLPLHWLCE
jgi:hypothetical protein